MTNSFNTQTNYINLLNEFDKLNSTKTTNDICTPLPLVEEMLNITFKLNPELLNNNISILDPCCGYGNFEAILYKYITNTSQYTLIDTNKERLELMNNLFKTHLNITFNIINTDFLTHQFTNKFDLIVCNSPYALIKDGKRTAKNHNLFSKFIIKSFELLKPNGVMTFIVPNSWLSLSDSNNIPLLLTSHHLQYLELNAKKHFPKVGSTFTWFVCKNIRNIDTLPLQLSCSNDVKVDIKVKCLTNANDLDDSNKINDNNINTNESNESNNTINNNINANDLNDSNIITINQSKVQFIPLIYNNIIKSILDKTILSNFDTFNIQTDSYLHKYTKSKHINNTQTDKFKYPLIHTLKQTVYSDIPHKNQNKYKIFISTTSYYETLISNYGNTQSIAYLLCSSKAEAIKYSNVLNCKLYKFINNICRWGNFNNIRILQLLPIYELNDGFINMNETDKNNIIYTHFKLTDDEISYIENNL